MKRTLSMLLLLCCVLTAWAQIVNPVTWRTTLETAKDGKQTIVFKATIEDTWHLYSMDTPEDGPQRTEFSFEGSKGIRLIGTPTVTAGTPIKHYDDAFGMELTYFEQGVTFAQRFEATAADYIVCGEITFMSCNDGMCTPPTREEFSLKGHDDHAKGEASAANVAEEADANIVDADTDVPADSLADATDAAASDALLATSNGDALWQPVIEQLKNFDNDAESDASGQTHSWWYILIAGFIAGLIALVTPCVWPMIPMTVSFFLKRTKDRKKSIRDAYTYGISIIVIYVLLGLIITAIFGASALNSLATNAVFNIIFFLLLVVFAFSFFGAFEIALPASWTTKLDEKADATTGLLSIFFMAFTLCLVSFSCTGPIIGTLLVEAATSGSFIYPAIGMFGFALALSIPFTLFAIFPSMLKSMPKSGGWLNAVKVVLGFLELALSLKFLSVADLAYGWGILDRETFVALWIVIFCFLGLYLLGKIKLAHDTDDDGHLSVTRLMLSLCSFAFAIYMLPGLWGAPLKAISAFAPPMSTQDFNLYDDGVEASYNDYDEGMAAARRAGKPVLVDFSGFGCVNCRKMEAAVWTDSSVKEIIDNDYILISLMVDDKTPLPEPIVITENGKQRTLKTVGDKWSYLQRYKFGANAQPFYVLLDAEGQPLNNSYAYNEDVEAYRQFLNTGKENFKKK
jgi:thiol:disulfide interchange protein DsbD